MLQEGLGRMVQFYGDLRKRKCSVPQDENNVIYKNSTIQSDVVNSCPKSVVTKNNNEEYFDDLSKYIIFDPLNSVKPSGSNPRINVEENDEQQKCDVVQPVDVLPSNVIYNEPKKYVWKQGFCLQLGSKGRKAMLQLIRNKYRTDKKYKRVFESKTPPTTISNLPFFKVSMLWELAHDLNVFDEAILIHKCFGTNLDDKRVTNGRKRGTRSVKQSETYKTINNTIIDVKNTMNKRIGVAKKINNYILGARSATPLGTFGRGMRKQNLQRYNTDEELEFVREHSIDTLGHEIIHANDNAKRQIRITGSTELYDNSQYSVSSGSFSTHVPSVHDDEETSESTNASEVENSKLYDFTRGGSKTNVRSGSKFHEYVDKYKMAETGSTSIEFGKLAVYLSHEYNFLNMD